MNKASSGLSLQRGTSLADPNQSLQGAVLQEGDHLTAIVQQAKMAATEEAFAMWCCGSGGDRIVTWGRPDRGGDSSAVQDQLRNVQQVQATDRAFAAILADGSVVTWGDPDYGGDSSAVQDHLRNVQQVQATWDAFAAILADGSVVTWGNPECGGDSSAARDQLRNAQQVQATSIVLLLRSWQMDLSFRGATRKMVVTALQPNISSGMCSRFRPQVVHFLRSWQMICRYMG